MPTFDLGSILKRRLLLLLAHTPTKGAEIHALWWAFPFAFDHRSKVGIMARNFQGGVIEQKAILKIQNKRSKSQFFGQSLFALAFLKLRAIMPRKAHLFCGHRAL
jgi:hypothetical protein